MSDWKYRCIDWVAYFVFCGVMIAAILAVASLIIHIPFDVGWPLVVVVATWLVLHKLRSPGLPGDRSK